MSNQNAESSTSNPGEQHFKDAAQNVLNVASLLTEISELNANIERCLFETGEALNISQPSSGGKIGLRWWKREGGKREPVIVEWKFLGKSGKLWPDPIGVARRPKKGVEVESTDQPKKREKDMASIRYLARRAKYKGSFAVNHEQTVELLEILSKLMEMRHSLTASMSRIKQSLTSLKREQGQVVIWQRKRVQEINEVIYQNMVRAGYYEIEIETEDAHK